MEYKVSELLDIAIALEKEGAEFYSVLAKVSKNKETQKIFEDFSRDEYQHSEMFKSIKSELVDDDNVDPDEELEGLIKLISQHNVLPEVPQGNIDTFHPLEALKLGLKTEKNTWKFYKKLLKSIKNEDSRKAVEKLILEEKHHFNSLNELYKTKSFDF